MVDDCDTVIDMTIFNRYVSFNGQPAFAVRLTFANTSIVKDALSDTGAHVSIEHGWNIAIGGWPNRVIAEPGNWIVVTCNGVSAYRHDAFSAHFTSIR